MTCSRTLAAASLLLAAGSAASAQSLSAGFGPPGSVPTQTDPYCGIMFDVAATHPSGLLLTSIDMNSRIAAGTPIEVEVYYKPGSHATFHNNRGAWTKLNSQVVTAAGIWQPTTISLGAGLVVPPSQTYALYISVVTNEGAAVYFAEADRPPSPSNADLFIDSFNARAMGGLFSGAGFSPRGFQGTIYYSNCGVVPCPAPPQGACCLYGSGTCVTATEANCRAVHNGFYHGDGTACGSFCSFIAETHPNNTKGEANAVALTTGRGISGTTTAASGTADPASPDYFLVTTGAAPPGVYRHRMVLGSAVAGHSAWIRGLTQTATGAAPWAGVVGSASGTESAGQTHLLEGTNRVNLWFGFGKEEQVYYRVAGTASTASPYYAILETTPVTPKDIGTFSAGVITIESVSELHTNDTSLRVWDADFNPVHGFSNDHASTNGGHSANATNVSFLRREFAAGTYYVGVTIGNIATDRGSPSDDNIRTGIMLDFPNAAVSTNASTLPNVSFTVTDSAGPVAVPAGRPGRGEVSWYKMTVTGTVGSGACCFTDGTCTELSEFVCLQQEGVYSGNGTGCTPNNCPQPGACCVPAGCIIALPGACADVSGTYKGPGTVCATADCPPPTVANIIGFNLTTATSTVPDPQNWNRIGTAVGTLSGVQDDSGAATAVNIQWSGGVGGNGFTYLSTSTLAADAVPQHVYDLTGMTGYGFRASGAFTIELTGLSPSSEYHYWFVAYRGAANISQTVQVSDGDVLNAISFDQIKPSAGGAYFVVNDTVANNTMDWNALYDATTSSSTGSMTFNWTTTGSETTAVLGALAIRRVLPTTPVCYANCDGSTTAPVLNVADFTCFLQRFAAGEAYANCDESTTVPTLNVADFTCFLQKFAAGCP